MALTITKQIYDSALAREGQDGTSVERSANKTHISTPVEAGQLLLDVTSEGKWIESVAAEIVFVEAGARAAVLDVLEIVSFFDESGSIKAVLSSAKAYNAEPSSVSMRENGKPGVTFDFEFKTADGKGTNLFGHSTTKPDLYGVVKVIFEELVR